MRCQSTPNTVAPSQNGCVVWRASDDVSTLWEQQWHAPGAPHLGEGVHLVRAKYAARCIGRHDRPVPGLILHVRREPCMSYIAEINQGNIPFTGSALRSSLRDMQDARYGSLALVLCLGWQPEG